MIKNQFQTDFLFADNSFLTGAGSVLNIAGNYFSYNGSETAEAADYRALLNDWGVVGIDLSQAIATHSINTQHEQSEEAITQQ